MIKKITGFTIGLLFLFSIHAQSGFVSISGDDSGSGTSSFTIGQVDFVNLSGGGYSVTEGIQQPYSGGASVPENLTLLNNIFIPLGDSCAAFLTSELFTLPSTTGLLVYASMSEIPSSFAEGAIYPIDTVYGEGEWMFGIYDPNVDEKGLYQLIGWGTFTTEDKIDPRFYGDTVLTTNDPSTRPNETLFNQYGTYKEVSYLAWSSFLSSSPTFRPGNWSCFQSTAHPDLSYSFPHDSSRVFDTLKLTPTADGILTIIAASKINANREDEEAVFDPVVAVYGKDGFSATNPCNNLIALGESSFISNPLAGLGFANNLQATSIDGAFEDNEEIFAPWLLHDDPVVRMAVKVTAGVPLTVLVTTREDVDYEYFDVYFMLDAYNGGGLTSPALTTAAYQPSHSSPTTYYDSLFRDTAFSYFDFICADVDDVMLPNQATLNQTSYLGGSYGELASWYNAMNSDSLSAAGGNNAVTQAEMQALGSAWRKYAAALLTDIGNDTVLVDLNTLDLSRLTHGAARKFMNDTLLFHYGYMPMVIENCDDWTVKITDAIQTYGDCGYDVIGDNGDYNLFNNIGSIITRTFVVSDGGTKTDLDTARIQLIFRNPNLYDVRLPHYTVNIECDEIQDGVASTHPSSTGYPFIATLNGFVDLTPSNAACNLAAGYEDYAEITACANNQSFRREWTVYDWCRPGTTIVYNQLIRVGDWTAPSKEAVGSVTFLEDANGCTGTVVVEAPEYSDFCGSVSLSAKVYRGAPSIDNEVGYFGSAVGGSGRLSDMGYGTYYVVWTVQDDCGNVAKPDTLHDTFSDHVSPSCVIDDMRSITLTNYGDIGTPTAIDDELERGQAWVTAERLDEGSWDNCGSIDSIHVRRMTEAGMSAWADAISFTCEDEGIAVLVELSVKDEAGNETICWTNITAVDKTQPECRDIGTVNYFCDELPSGDDLSGTSSVWGQFFDDSLTLVNISKDELCSSNMQVFDTEVSIDQCGYGYVNRYYRVYREIDGKEFADSCRMSIVFNELHDYSITFPADVAETCKELPASGITYVEGGCDLITVSVVDETFDATADECYKIYRTFNVINWCEYDEEALGPIQVARSDWNNDGVVGDETTIVVKYNFGSDHIFTDYQNAWGSVGSDVDRRDTVYGGYLGFLGIGGWQTPVLWAAQDPPNALDGTATEGDFVLHTNISNGTNQPIISNISRYSPGIFSVSVPALSNGSVPRGGYFQYIQVLKVYDEEEPTITYAASQDSFPSYSNAEGCPGDVIITATLDDDCTQDINQVQVTEAYLDAFNDAGAESVDFDADVMADISQGDGQVTYAGTDLPAGTHRLRLVVRDGCGNVRVEDHVFTVYDAKGPAPICIEGFAAELMPLEDGTAGMAVVNAVDFVINNPIADCSGAVSAFEITRVTADIDAILAADDLASSLTLDCADKGQMDVAVVARDAAGNSDYCVTTITVQDNITPCPDLEISLTGNITTEDLNTVSGVELQLNEEKKYTTGIDGGYFFDGLTLGGDYSVVPTKKGDDLNGVSTYDLVLISKHILGITALNSPYKMIAADVNNSGTISTLDMILIRQRLLLQRENFSDQTNSWRFVPADYSFPNASNPWAAAFPEVLNINDFNGTANSDFVAIKVGDVNNSALIDVQPRSNASFALHVEDLTVKAGNEYTVNFKAIAADVEGFQFALNFEGLELVDIVEGVVKADHFGSKFADEGILLTSWNGSAAEGELFSLVFRATHDVVLSEALSVSTRHSNAEAYNTAGEAMNVAINFNSGAVAAANFELKQNTPNPFKGETVIGFNLAEASNATLTINDVTGSVLKVVRGDFAKGANQISIDSKELPAAGVLYYTLTAGAYTATKKMIIVE